MTPENYKKYIIKMLDSISSDRDLAQIYTIVHRKFIRKELEQYERKN